jgi:hypothetical protein
VNGAVPSGVGIEAEREVMHDRVADQHDVDDAVARDAGVAHELRRSPRGARPDRAVSSWPPFVVHHHVRHAAHEVFAEPDLRVHDPRRRDDLAGREVAEMPGDRGGADVDSHAVGGVDEAGPHRADPVAPCTATVTVRAPAQRGRQRGDDTRAASAVREAPLLGERVEQAAQLAAVGAESGAGTSTR